MPSDGPARARQLLAGPARQRAYERTPLPQAQTPGLVIADPDSGMIGAAVALAAGHFQPLMRLGAFHLPPGVRGAAESTRRFDDVLTLVEAWGFARGIEARAAATVANYDKLGDDCDFLTLAGDWPYRYRVEAAEGPARGVYALDDLIGRTLSGGPSLGGLERSTGGGPIRGGLLVIRLPASPCDGGVVPASAVGPLVEHIQR